ncbi:N-formylglutamate amidohydrolase [Chloroflexi bacterium TSY]|nr:N-formylglutamate amidohydrolase [Chloroflexi bacterium TSY]
MNSNGQLPVILSRPHGGLSVPSEVEARLAVTDVALYNDCDLWVDQLFDFDQSKYDRSSDLHTKQNDAKQNSVGETEAVLETISMPIARALIDVNRPPEWLGKSDGPVKTQTSYGEQIYKQPLSFETQTQLMERYWQPYHKQIEVALQTHAQDVNLLIDCHNMAQHGPTAYRDAGQARPLICIANMGDHHGEPKPDRGWTSCPPWFARKAAEIAEELFHDMKLLEPEQDRSIPTVLLNSPFGGSYILRKNLNLGADGDYTNSNGVRKPIGIMIEVNRGLLVGDQYATRAIAPPNEQRIDMVRQRLYQWTKQLVQYL